ncbi:MAG: histidine triad nucleotide-binding protein [Nitrososphaerales archaeon]
MSKDCLFCKISSKEIPADIVYEDDKVLAFRDINPQAPIHMLIIPHRHISNLNEANANDQELLGYMVLTAAQLAKDNGVDESGYRLVMNCNEHGGQTVFHIHLHILAGRQLTHLG